VIYAVILRPLPYPDPERLVWITQYFPRFDATLVSGNDFLAWEEQAKSFETLAAWSAGPFAVEFDKNSEQLRGVSVSKDYLATLGVRPIAGRLFAVNEHEPGANAVVLLGEAIWRDRFDSSPDTVGTFVRINRQPHTVVGVLPRSSAHVERGDFWIPLRLTRAQVGDPINLVRVLGRLALHSDVRSAKTELELLARRSQEESFGSPSDSTAGIVSLHEKLVGNIRQSLFLLWGAVVLVLLLTCANVMNLMLARMSSRAREVSLKFALGARRVRLVRQMLTESLLLSLAGAAAGLALATKGIPFLLELLPEDLPRHETVSLDSATLFFTVGVSMLASVVFGTVPALRASKSSLSEVLKSSTPTLAGNRAASGLQNGLVVSQFALATVLAVSAALLTQTFVKVRAVDHGFVPDGLLTAEVQLPSSRFPSASQQREFVREALTRIRALPGVSEATATTGLPLSSLDGSMAFFSLEGDPPWGPEQAPAHRTRVHYVDDDFFSTLSIPLLAGDLLIGTDRESGARPVVISKTFAQKAFPIGVPVGRRLKLGIPEGPDPWLTIVGVAGDIKHSSVNDDEVPTIYRSYREAGSLAAAAFVVKSTQDSTALALALRNEIRRIDPGQPLHGVMTMQQRMHEAVSSERERALLLGVFAATAIILAGAGVFGVLSHIVARQRPELGVRMALGAQTADIFRLVFARGLGLAAIGIALGLAASVPAARLVRGFLFDVQSTDFASLLLTSAVLAAVAFVACYLPARRASRVDPATVLRWD
jgi:putative ABC transport system permease protein